MQIPVILCIVKESVTGECNIGFRSSRTRFDSHLAAAALRRGFFPGLGCTFYVRECRQRRPWKHLLLRHVLHVLGVVRVQSRREGSGLGKVCIC